MTAMDDKVAAVTVIFDEPVTLPCVAVIVVVPAATAVAKPPDAIVAVAGLEDVQPTVLLRFCVVPSV